MATPKKEKHLRPDNKIANNGNAKENTMKKTTMSALAALAMLTFAATSCTKSTQEATLAPQEVENLTASTQDDAIADQIFAEIHEQEMGLVDEFDVPGIGLNSDISINQDSLGNRCVKMTIVPRNPMEFPKTVTVDYGNGCPGRDGRVRKGKMITVYSAPMIRPGATAVTRFENFYVGKVKVEGRHSTRNNSTSDVRIFTRQVENGKLTFEGGGVMLWEATHTNKQVDGLGTPGFPFDDAFEVTGGARGINERAGNRLEWSRRIESPLQKTFRCRWIQKGTVVIVRNNNRALLNFGDGTCDNKATLTINGQVKEITL